MALEISQFVIPDRQLLTKGMPSSKYRLTDIGEAKITRTIFGRAKVCITCEHDKMRRAWLLTTLVATLLSAAMWQVWLVAQQAEAHQNEPPPLPLSARIKVSQPAFLPEYVQTLNNAQSIRRAGTSLQTDISKMVSTQKLPPPAPLKPNNQMTANPVVPQLPIANKQPAAIPAAKNVASINQSGIQQPNKLLNPIQSVAPALEATSGSSPPANKSPIKSTSAAAPETSIPVQEKTVSTDTDHAEKAIEPSPAPDNPAIKQSSPQQPDAGENLAVEQADIAQ